MTADEVVKKLPLAQAQQYLCALAINNGAHPVWIDEHDSAEDITEQARGVLLAALRGSGSV
jgi:hypothetical protein